jgi:hypothetical protein
MTAPIQLHVTGLAGTVTLTVNQPHGDHVHQLLSLMLDPPAVQELIGQLQAAVSGQPPAPRQPRVTVRKDTWGGWVFACGRCPTVSSWVKFSTHAMALSAARTHAGAHAAEVGS